MVWLTWRQQRRAAIVGVLLFSIAAIMLDLTRRVMSSVLASAARSCGSAATGVFCGTSADSAFALFNFGEVLKVGLMAFPVLAAVFVAAPMVANEVERGTHIFIWTQSVGRMHWFTVKAALIAAPILACAIALAVLAGWWQQPFSAMTGNGSWSFFDVFGIAPVAYAAFAIGLGLAAGTMVRKTIPAMATTLLAFVVARIGVSFIRPHFLPPVVSDSDLAKDPFPAGSLQLDLYWTDASRNRIDPSEVYRQLEENFPGSVGTGGPTGATPVAGKAAEWQWLHDHGYHLLSVYQPADRMWTFQAIEAAIFLALAVFLFGTCAWWLKQRVN